MCLERNTEKGTFNKNKIMKNGEEEKTRCAIIDNKLTFKSHVKSICKKHC